MSSTDTDVWPPVAPEPSHDLAARARAVLTPNYNPPPIIFDRGEGVWLWDEAGRRYLDFAAGIAVCAIGHAHPTLARTLAEQASKLLHVSNLFLTRPIVELAEALCARSFADQVFFINSGAEAVESALKLARRYFQSVRGEDRYEIITMEHSFHGRTWAAISATGQPKYHVGFKPLVPGFKHVPFGDVEAVRAAIGPHTAAVMLEPVQGEGGVAVAPPGYLEGLRALCDEHGILLILDEVQTGIGRTGRWFAYEHSTITPDIITLAKGLGGGVAIGAILTTAEVGQGFAPGVHASTFGGNPLACAAGLAVIEVIEKEKLIERSAQMGAYMLTGLERLVGRFGVTAARGQGLLCGIQIDAAQNDRAKVLVEARDRGLLATLAGADVLRLSPPLNVSEAHIDEALQTLEQSLEAIYAQMG